MLTDAAFAADPAACPAEVCPDAGDAAALAAFPWWSHRMSYGAALSGFFLGTANGALWALACDHCAPPTDSATFASGPYAGQTFALTRHPVCDTAAWAQLGNSTPCAAPSGQPHSLLLRFEPLPGETLPEVPLVRFLAGRWPLIPDDALVLRMGTGAVNTHPTVGWFTECAMTQAGGQPVGGRPACCTAHRIADQYEGGVTSLRPPSRLQGGGIYNVSGWGGEGDFSGCGPAGLGLEYLGATWEETAAGWRWVTFRCAHAVSSPRVTTSRRAAGGYGCLRFHDTPAGLTAPGLDLPSENRAAESGYSARCFSMTSGPGYHPVTRPANVVPSHVACSYTPGAGVSAPWISASVGDSGSQLFVFMAGLWWYAGPALAAYGSASLDPAGWWGQIALELGIASTAGAP